jgi:hypothetical protein
MSKKPVRQTREEVEAILAQALAEAGSIEDGVQREKYPNGKLKSEEEIKNGQRIYAKNWHDNGVLASEMSFKNDEIHGKVKSWNRKGELLGEYTLNEGLGLMKEWNEDGTLNWEREVFKGDVVRFTTFADVGHQHTVYLHNNEPISKKKFVELGGVVRVK